MLNEDLYVLYDTKLKILYRAQTWAGGRPSLQLKTWKTLTGAIKALDKLSNSRKENNLIIAKLDIKDINEEIH